jgi:hypothetical protein
LEFEGLDQTELHAHRAMAAVLENWYYHGRGLDRRGYLGPTRRHVYVDLGPYAEARKIDTRLDGESYAGYDRPSVMSLKIVEVSRETM